MNPIISLKNVNLYSSCSKTSAVVDTEELENCSHTDAEKSISNQPSIDQLKPE